MKNELVFWTDPSTLFSDLHREVDRAFSGVLDPGFKGSGASFVPRTEIEEEENHFLIHMDVPGVKKEDIRIETRDNSLSVSGTRSSGAKKGQNTEKVFGSFERVFTLPSTVDASRIEADCSDGVLTIALPKAEAIKPRQIPLGSRREDGFFSKLIGQSKKGEAA